MHAAVLKKSTLSVVVVLGLGWGIAALPAPLHSASASQGVLGDSGRSAVGRGAEVVKDFSPVLNGSVLSFALQADGKLLIGGRFTSVNGQDFPCIARLNSDGSVDRTFSPELDCVDDQGVTGLIGDILVRPNGQVVIGGEFFLIGGETVTGVARLNADGSLDPEFAYATPEGTTGLVGGLASQSDGKILVGYAWAPAVRRLDVSGALDPTFNAPEVNGGTGIFAIAVQGDGGILIGGSFTRVGDHARRYVARLNSNGSLDTGFESSPDYLVKAIALEPAGRVLIGGWFTAVGESDRPGLARLNADGSLDAGFRPGVGCCVEAIEREASGNLVVGGLFGEYPSGGSPSNRGVVRLAADGSLDPDWIAQADEPVRALLVRGDGAILAGGGFSTITGYERRYIALLTSGSSSTVPGRVSDLRAKPGKGRLLVSWSAPQDLGGASAVTYEYRVGRKAWKSTPQTSVSVRGEKGTRMKVTVRAVNAAGAGPAATVSGIPK